MLDRMGWIDEDASDHEGYVAFTIDDGRVAGASRLDGVWVPAVVADKGVAREVRDFPDGTTEALLPWERVVFWRAQCSCGWAGGMRPATETDPRGQRDCPDLLADEVFLPQWQEHIADVTTLISLRRLARKRAELDQEIDQAASRARAAGHSWNQIGAAVGISKQAAQQRWGTSTIDPATAQRWSWTPGEQPRSLPSPRAE